VRAVEQENRRYFGAIYGSKSPLAHWLRARVSWDQQSKAQLGLRVLRPYLERRRAAGLLTRVLDFGCGWGSLLLSLPRHGVRSWGYDLVPEVVGSLAGAMRLARRPFAVATIDLQGRIEPHALDVIVCSHVLEHVSDDRALLRTLRFALVPGGLLLLNVPIHEVRVDPRHARGYDEASLLALLSSEELEVIEVHAADRLSGTILRAELADRSWLGKGAFRALRGALALTPLPARNLLERLFVGAEPAHQLLVLCRRPP
jgi:2-polyprenyl-3-methyl-5-hydroxy-6-metoxy-1,4-benzoquinol methylase